MAIVSIKPIPDGLGGGGQGNIAVDCDRPFRIITNTNYDDPNTLMFDPLLPLIGSSHPLNPWSTLREWSFRTAVPGTARIWIGTARYSSRPESREEREKRITPNPLLRRCSVSMGFENHNEFITNDASGNVFKNSAGAVFLTGQSRQKARLTIEVTKNLPAYPTFFFTHVNKLNAGPIVIYSALGPILIPAKRALFSPVGIVDVQQEGSFPYVEAKYQLTIDEKEHKLLLVDEGEYWFEGGVKKVSAFPQLLDGAGGKSTGATYFREFDIYETADFSSIPLS